MDIQIQGIHCSLVSYFLGNCYITEIALPESGETIARGISSFSSVQSERDATQKANQRLSHQRFRDLELTVGG